MSLHLLSRFVETQVRVVTPGPQAAVGASAEGRVISPALGPPHRLSLPLPPPSPQMKVQLRDPKGHFPSQAPEKVRV